MRHIGQQVRRLALLNVGPKCTLAASHAAPWGHSEYAGGTDKQRDGRQTITLRFLLD